MAKKSDRAGGDSTRKEYGETPVVNVRPASTGVVKRGETPIVNVRPPVKKK